MVDTPLRVKYPIDMDVVNVFNNRSAMSIFPKGNGQEGTVLIRSVRGFDNGESLLLILFLNHNGQSCLVR